jgi:hypothetical protein
MGRRPGWFIALLAGAGLAGCPEEVASSFPLEVGYSMLEPCQGVLPLEVGAESSLGEIVSGSGGGHDYAHARAYVLAPIEDVWLALQDPCVSRIHTDEGFEALPGEEDFPLSFRVKVREDSENVLVGIVDWTHTYRGGEVEEEPGGRLGYGMRYQKTQGLENVRVQSGSLETFPVGDPPSATEIAYVHWLDADRSGVAQARGAVNDWFMDLLGELGQLGDEYQGAPVKPEWKICAGNGEGLD